MLNINAKTESQITIDARLISKKFILLRQEIDNIMVGREQAEELALVLKHYAETGELPE